MGIRRYLVSIMGRREPDFIIGGRDHPYLLRWWVIPRNRFFNVYLHRFLRSDDDRALHDHPWLFNCSVLLEGDYLEYTFSSGASLTATHRQAGDWKFRWGKAPHRVELVDGMPCTTIFITGPVVREWGFYCPSPVGWIPWKRFTNTRDKGAVGAGCDG